MNPGVAYVELRKATYQRVSTIPYLLQNTKGVFDGTADPDTEYPYVTIGEVTEVPDDLLNRIGRQVTLTIHAWSNYEGELQNGLIMNEIVKFLNRQPMSVTDWHVVSVVLESIVTFNETHEVRHTVGRFRYKVEALTS